MSHYQRFFTAGKGTPLDVALRAILKQRALAAKAVQKFARANGISNVYGNSWESYRFDLKDYKNYDAQKWRKTKPVRGQWFFVPRLNTPEGKALAEQVKALPPFPSWNTALDAVPGLHHGFPAIIEGSTGYSPYVKFYTKDLVLIAIPWRDEDPKKLEKYRKQHGTKGQREWSATMEYLLWTPPDWLHEIKEWEALKLIDEHKEKP